MAVIGSRRTEYLPIEELVFDERNPKGHSLDRIDASYEEFGFVEPIVLDERTGKLVAGHGRVEQLRARQAAGGDPPDGIEVGPKGEWTMPVVRGWSSKDDKQAAAYLVASNRITEVGGWNDKALVDLLGDLPEVQLEASGFTMPELADLRVGLGRHPYGAAGDSEDEEDPDDIPAVPENPVTVSGDVWELGSNRIMCGDCRVAKDVDKLLDGQRINLAFTSPPYADRRKYDPTSGFKPVPPDGYVKWFAPVSKIIAERIQPDGSWFINIKPGVSPEHLDAELYVFDLVIAHVREWGWHFGTEFCWERGGMPGQIWRRFKNQFEPVYQFSRGDWKFRPDAVRHPSDSIPVNFGPGSRVDWTTVQGHGKTLGIRKNASGSKDLMEDHQGSTEALLGVGEYTIAGMALPGNRLPTFAGSHEATGHTAAFPVGLPEFFVLAYTDIGDVVYDPFVGSGSTILAAHGSERIGLGMEISPAYVDVTCARWQRLTGELPRLRGSNEPHDFLGELQATE